MPLIETKGAASAQGFGGAGAGASGPVTYIEDVFSTWLYTGNSSTQTITNGIDLSGKGGMIWTKSRSGSFDHAITDSTRYLFTPQQWYRALNTNTTAAEWGGPGTTVNSTGYSLTGDFGSWWNESGYTYASWTFRKQPKFFDIVTWTGNAATPRTITHNLGSVPGCIIVKKYIGTAEDWFVFHRSMGNTGTFQYFCILNSTAAQDTGGYGMEKASSWTSTTFSLVSAGGSSLNESGATYVAYLFAHDAGGFGLSGTDNVISCGSYTGNGLTDGPVINLSYEPQWVMIKRTDSTGNWALIDIMRGFPNTGSAGNYDNGLLANTSGAETTTSLRVKPTSTGFSPVGGDADTNASGGTYIYIAIRRGPMKVPTSGTSVFSPLAYSGLVPGSGNVTRTSGFPIDFIWARLRNGTVGFGPANSPTGVLTRLTGGLWAGSTTAATPIMATLSTDPETTQNTGIFGASNTGFVTTGNTGGLAVDTGSGEIYVAECFRRAPGFFDVVCYTGNGTTSRDVTHNLGVKPELVIVKSRSAATTNWVAGAYVNSSQFNLWLNSTVADGSASSGGIAYTQFSTASNFRLSATGGVVTDINTTSATYVAYLFATVGGVSKVGSYTGTGALQTVNCGFTSGARFVLIKRTDSTGDWYVYDSARGISSGNDPYLLLNSTAAEVTGTNYVDTTSVGFQVTAAAPAGLNANGGTYIFLAIA